MDIDLSGLNKTQLLLVMEGMGYPPSEVEKFQKRFTAKQLRSEIEYERTFRAIAKGRR